MFKNLTATNKGVLTGTVMIVLSCIFFYSGQPFDSPLQYLIYVIYAGGIAWTIYEFSKAEENTNKLGPFFLQGFKCFIVITLLMVIFTFVFNKLHPEFKDDMVKAYTIDMLKKGNTTAAEMETNLKKAKDYYLTMLLSGAIFGYLLIGSTFTLVTSLFFTKRN